MDMIREGDKNNPIRIDDFQRIKIMAEKEIFSHKADVLRQRAEEKAVRITENLEAMSLEEIYSTPDRFFGKM